MNHAFSKMRDTNQTTQLRAKVWKIGNAMSVAMQIGGDFKQFVLGTLFYRSISESSTNYIEGGDDSATPKIKGDTIKTEGYFIYCGQLFINTALKKILTLALILIQELFSRLSRVQ